MKIRQSSVEENSSLPDITDLVGVCGFVLDRVIPHQPLTHWPMRDIRRTVLKAFEVLPIQHIFLQTNKRDRVKLTRIPVIIPVWENYVRNQHRFVTDVLHQLGNKRASPHLLGKM